ncbi:hypothetical protein HDU98_004172 [Podochytrium sp. JEL0797]|nr:hypothetical protein HDU98_004172 [Podochytrium sp. JEL0797]
MSKSSKAMRIAPACRSPNETHAQPSNQNDSSPMPPLPPLPPPHASIFQTATPTELIQDIFSHLPLVAETQQFRRLAKRFNAALSSTSFARLHINRQMPPRLRDSPILSCTSDNFGILLFVNDGVYRVYREAYIALKRHKTITEVDFIGGTETQIRFGLAMDSLLHVTQLSLTWTNLGGELPESIGKLVGLESLCLSGNRLEGCIPDSLFGLERLKELRLDNNRMSGAISERISQLTQLKVLWLQGNRFSGSIPQAMTSLRGLRELRVGENRLTGRIPDGLERVQQLELFPNLLDAEMGGVRAWRDYDVFLRGILQGEVARN